MKRKRNASLSAGLVLLVQHLHHTALRPSPGCAALCALACLLSSVHARRFSAIISLVCVTRGLSTDCDCQYEGPRPLYVLYGRYVLAGARIAEVLAYCTAASLKVLVSCSNPAKYQVRCGDSYLFFLIFFSSPSARPAPDFPPLIGFLT